MSLGQNRLLPALALQPRPLVHGQRWLRPPRLPLCLALLSSLTPCRGWPQIHHHEFTCLLLPDQATFLDTDSIEKADHTSCVNSAAIEASLRRRTAGRLRPSGTYCPVEEENHTSAS